MLLGHVKLLLWMMTPDFEAEAKAAEAGNKFCSDCCLKLLKRKKKKKKKQQQQQQQRI